MRHGPVVAAHDDAATFAAEHGTAAAVDAAPLLDTHQKAADSIAASPLRWLVLLTFALVSAQQQMGWVLPGAVQPNFTAVYGMDEDTIQFLTNYGCWVFIVFAVPSAWALDRLGIRVPVLACVGLMLACSGLRYAARDASVRSVAFVHLAMILDAIVGPVVMAAPTKLAEDFFPPSERTVATAVAALSNQCGSVFVYALVPLLCRDASEGSLRALNLALLVLSAANAALAALYFPAHPPRAPSASADAARRNESAVTLRSLLGAWRAFARVPPYVVLVAVCALIVGAANPQGALLEPNLANLGATEATAGWTNAGAQAASLVVGVATSAGVDALKARARWLHKAALVGATAAAGCFYLAYAITFVLPPALAGAALPAAIGSYVAANACLGAAIPLYYDAAAEHVFGKAPDGAGEAAMLMGIVLPLNVVGLAVLVAPASSFFAWIKCAADPARCTTTWVPPT